MSGALKRKFPELEEEGCFSSSSRSSSAYSGWDSEGDSCYSDTLDSTPSNPSSPATPASTNSILRTAKRVSRRGNVQFEEVLVYYFPRCQGYSSVPSHGGCSLGMVPRHSALRRFTLAEFSANQQQRRAHRLALQLRQERLQALRTGLTESGVLAPGDADRLTLADVPEVELDLSAVDLDQSSFLQPYPWRRRRALLKASGVRRIDKEERRELAALRAAREECGCSCQGLCHPDTCSCSIAGIKCQMDHSSFPCGCSRDGCGNRAGRVEFNSGRVHTHYIHTVMRLALERALDTQTPPKPAGGSVVLTFPFSEDSNSDMSDASSEGGMGGARSLPSPLGVDEGGLTRILSFSDADTSQVAMGDGTRQPAGEFSIFGYTVSTVTDSQAITRPPQMDASKDTRPLSISDLLDDNANQDGGLVHGPRTLTPDPTLGPTLDRSLDPSGYGELGLLDSFPCLAPISLYDAPRDCDPLDGLFPLQLPCCSGDPSDPGTTIESLIGLSESVPEPPAAFTDHQLLEEALYLSTTKPIRS